MVLKFLLLRQRICTQRREKKNVATENSSNNADDNQVHFSFSGELAENKMVKLSREYFAHFYDSPWILRDAIFNFARCFYGTLMNALIKCRHLIYSLLKSLFT